jgi:tyrosyl-tRNA synthetase
MSASRGNYIALKEDPNEQFGKAMRVPDELLPQYYRLVMERGEPAGDPMEAKLELAGFIVRRAWGDDKAREAEEHFTRTVRRGEAPEDVATVHVEPGELYVPKLLANAFGNSVSYWRRVMAQRGVRVDGHEALTEFRVPSEELDGKILFAGKRQFLQILVRGSADARV